MLNRSLGTSIMDDLSLYLQDIIQNSIAAKSSKIECIINEDQQMTITIIDNGCGMTHEELEKALTPFYTTRTTRKVGLGLPMIQMLTEQTEGKFEIQSEKNEGTRLDIHLNHHHIDMPPIGNLGEMVYMVSIHQDVEEFIFTYRYQQLEYQFVLSEMKELLGQTFYQYSLMKAVIEMINNEIINIRGVL
jgi:anti-sigma regulatory factor (Ser/Thr protein kinase)